MLELLSFRRVVIITLAVVVTLAFVQGIRQASSVLILIFISLLFATAVKPPVTWLQGRGVPRSLAIILVYLVALGAIALLGLIVFPPLIGEVLALFRNAPSYYERVVSLLTNSTNPVLRQINEFLLSEQITAWAAARAGGLAGSLAGSLVDIGATLLGAVIAFVTLLTVGFYWISEQSRIERTWFSIVPPQNRIRLLATWRGIEERLGAYLRGLTVLCLSVGVLCGVGYGVIGIRYALVLGVLAGVLEAIPTIGVLITAIIVTLVALPQGITTALLALAWTMVVQQVENTFLVPRVMGQAIGVSPLTLIVALLVFGGLLGPIGALLAVPFAAIVQIVVEEWVIKEPVVANLAVETRPQAIARLRLIELRAHLRRRLRASDSPLRLEAGPDAALYQLEIAVERAIQALPPIDTDDPTSPATAAAWAAAQDELERVRRLLAQADSSLKDDRAVAATLEQLERVLSDMNKTETVAASA